MTDGYLLNLRAFREVEDSKAQALEPLEEAAEAFGAWQECDDMRFSPIMTARREYRQNLIDECMDVVQAVVNLLDAEEFTQEDVDAAIERHFGGAGEPRMCGNCRHFCGCDIQVDYGYCHLGFERAYDTEAPDRKEGRWRLAKWAAAWLTGNLLYCEDECDECRDYEEVK